MFNVNLKFEVIIYGCPKSGLAAVDFRKASGLPESPSNTVPIVFDATHEAICREWPQYLNTATDIMAHSTPGFSDHDVWHGTSAPDLVCPRRRWLGAFSTPNGGRHTVAAPVIAAFLADPWNGMSGLFQAIAESTAKSIAQVDLEEAAARETEEKEAAEKAARDAERKAAEVVTHAKKQAAVAELEKWTREYGSELAKARLDEGYASWIAEAHENYIAAAVQRLAVNCNLTPATIPDVDYSPLKTEPRKSPTLAEITTLKAVRAAIDQDDDFGDPELIYVEYTWDLPDDCDDYYDESDSPEPINRCELRIEITCPDGYTHECDFMIPEKMVPSAE